MGSAARPWNYQICGGAGSGSGGGFGYVLSRSPATLKSRCPLPTRWACLAADVKPVAVLAKPPAKGPSLTPPPASDERNDFVYQMYSRAVRFNERSGERESESNFPLKSVKSSNDWLPHDDRLHLDQDSMRGLVGNGDMSIVHSLAGLAAFPELKSARRNVVCYAKNRYIIVKQKWGKPRPGYIKINTDASLVIDPNSFSIDSSGAPGDWYIVSAIARDSKGDPICAVTIFVKAVSIDCAELRAIELGADLALELQCPNVIIESDSFNAMRRLDPTKWGQPETIIEDEEEIARTIKEKLAPVDNLEFNWVDRKLNRAADRVAYLAREKPYEPNDTLRLTRFAPKELWANAGLILKWEKNDGVYNVKVRKN